MRRPPWWLLALLVLLAFAFQGTRAHLGARRGPLHRRRPQHARARRLAGADARRRAPAPHQAADHLLGDRRQRRAARPQRVGRAPARRAGVRRHRAAACSASAGACARRNRGCRPSSGRCRWRRSSAATSSPPTHCSCSSRRRRCSRSSRPGSATAPTAAAGCSAMWLAWGLAFMTKGPPGLLPLRAMVAFLAIHDRPRLRGLFAAARACCCLRSSRSPGSRSSSAQQPDGLGYFLGYEVYDRVFTAAHDRNAQWYGGVRGLPAGAARRSAAVVAIGARGRGRARAPRGAAARAGAARDREAAAAALLVPAAARGVLPRPLAAANCTCCRCSCRWRCSLARPLAGWPWLDGRRTARDRRDHGARAAGPEGRGRVLSLPTGTRASWPSRSATPWTCTASRRSPSSACGRSTGSRCTSNRRSRACASAGNGLQYSQLLADGDAVRRAGRARAQPVRAEAQPCGAVPRRGARLQRSDGPARSAVFEGDGNEIWCCYQIRPGPASGGVVLRRLPTGPQEQSR